MRIRRATNADVERIMEIYHQAAEYMRANGNPTQWVGGYPFLSIIEEDITLERLYLLVEGEEQILAQFCYFVGEDPTYGYIDGAWLNDESYGVVHRLASSGKVRGVAKSCLEWCFERHPNMRIDTHSDNHAMKRLLCECGYSECGEIIVYNGTRRTAFQRTE